MNTDRNRISEFAYFLLRVVAGALMVMPGGTILFGWLGGMPGAASPPPMFSQMWIGGVLEFFGGLAIVLGFATRPVAFVLSGTMAVAYWQFHAPSSIWPTKNQGIPAILLCFIFLYMATLGSGCCSIDAFRRRKRAG